MAKVVNKVATVVGVLATIASYIPGPHQGIAKIVAAAATVAAAASAVAIKKPPARGSTSNILIGANMPLPYTIGRTHVGGNQVHDVGYGGEVSDVINPYRSMALVWSGAGPIDSIESFQADFSPITFSGGNAVGYYNNFLYLDTQLGDSPESSALAGPFGAIPDWGASYKLSGFAAGLITAKFDKKAKRYASGLPQFGAVIKGVRVYDPRLDDTYPGGSGDHRFDDEATWEWSENPALHAIAYARGRYQNGKKVFGCGFREEAIDLAAWVEFANTCDENEWAVGGTLYEPGSKWDNLKRICAAGAAEPVFVGARLSVKFNAPKVALDTITAADLADGEISIPAMKTWRDRINGIVPRYRSEEHKWEYVQSDLVQVEEYVTEDGEEKTEERQIDLIQNKDQAAQVATYELVNARELSPIVIPCKPRLIEYVVGEALTVDLPEAGMIERLCVIRGRRFDPATGIVELTLETETTDKHAFVLGQTGTAPPTPALLDGEELDDIATNGQPSGTPHVVASEAEMIALVAVEGDVAIRTDVSSTFIHNGGTTGTAADWTEALSPLGPSDGDKGDIVVSSSGGTYMIDNNAVSFAKMADLATDRLIGRDTAGTGDPEAITVGGGIEFTGSGGIQTSAFTGDATKTAGGTALTLASIISAGGPTGSATVVPIITYDAKGRLTAVSSATIAPAVGSITGLGTGVATALAVNVGSAGAFVTFNGAGGTPSSLTLTNATGLPISGLVASTVTAIGVGSIELGHASDTTLARSGAGDVTIEGNAIYRAGGTDVPVTDGGTGRSTSTTAYGLLAAGTTATGAHQTLAAGATTEILVGGGASALPAWTTATGTGAPARAGSPTFTGTITAAAATFSGQVNVTGGLKESGTVVSRFENTEGAIPSGCTGQGFEIFGNGAVGGLAGMRAYNRTTNAYAPMGLDVSSVSIRIGGTTTLRMVALQNFANDAAAAAGGLAINDWYRNGSVLMVRVA